MAFCKDCNITGEEELGTHTKKTQKLRYHSCLHNQLIKTEPITHIIYTLIISIIKKH